MTSIKELLEITNKVQKGINAELKKGVEDYHTGLLGEQMIVASYQTMPIDKLEAMRFIINKIIKKKKDFIRVQNAKSNPVDNDRDSLSHNEKNE